jgi:hypothetical protein
MLIRILFFVGLFSLASLNVSAQRFKAGLRAGIAGTQISGDQLGGFDKAGIVAGGLVNTSLSQKFDLAFEILYVQKGSRKNADPDNNDFVSYLLRLNYFEVPVLLQWKYSKRFTFEAGPAFGALVGSLEEDEFGKLDQPREFSNFEVGVAGGMSVLIVDGLYFNLRGTNSVLPVREHVSGQDYRLNRGQYNSSLLFTFQYIFNKTASAE